MPNISFDGRAGQCTKRDELDHAFVFNALVKVSKKVHQYLNLSSHGGNIPHLIEIFSTLKDLALQSRLFCGIGRSLRITWFNEQRRLGSSIAHYNTVGNKIGACCIDIILNSPVMGVVSLIHKAREANILRI